MCERIGAMPAPPPTNTISASVSRAKNSPNGPDTTAVSPGLSEKIHDETTPGGTSSAAPGGGVAMRTLSITTPFSSG